MTSRATELERISKGLCKRCGAPALDGTQMCAKHTEEQKRQNRESANRRRRRERRVAAARNADNTCPVCGKSLEHHPGVHLHRVVGTEGEVLLCATCSFTVNRAQQRGTVVLLSQLAAEVQE